MIDKKYLTTQIDQTITTLLDDYLLGEGLRLSDVKNFLLNTKDPRFPRHLSLVGLDRNMLENEAKSFEPLLQLRVLLTNFLDPSQDFINCLKYVTLLYRLIVSYIQDEIETKEFKHQFNKLRHTYTSEQIDCLINRLTYDLAFATAPPDDYHYKSKNELVNSSILVRNRLMKYWQAILGEP